mmetsp:Transcript_30943/g.57942  ORF Transcript_30943/g.57942 Transcript_30943/m.57942 type:complete len:759 (+) Transcript_30943:51-2327(+)
MAGMCCHSVAMRLHPLMLFLAMVLAVTLDAEVVGDVAASHSARVALAALDEVDASEAALLNEERHRIDSGELTPLEAGESLHVSLIPHLEAAVLALRHALAAGVVTEVADLAELAALDTQLSAMVSAQAKEPLFFWHGPRRLVLPRLRRVLGSARGQLEALVARRADGPPDLHDLLGVEAPTEPAVVSEQLPNGVLSHDVPRIGFAVGDSACGEAASCDIDGTLAKAEAVHFTGIGSAVHLAVQAASQTVLQRIGTALRDSKAHQPWISLRVLPKEATQLKAAVHRMLKDLHKESVNLLWVPYDGFRKVNWKKVKPQLEDLLKSGKISAYGVQAEVVRGKKLAKQLFEREPAPIAWLTSHDFLKPADREALQVAREHGLAVVAQPRQPPAAVRDYLEAAVGRDQAVQQAAQCQWAMRRGFSLLADLSDDLQAVLQELQDLQVSEEAMQLLDSVDGFLRPEKVEVNNSVEVFPQQDVPKGLEQRLQHWRRAAAYAAIRHRGSDPAVDAIVDAHSIEISGELAPGVNSAVLHTLDDQARRYKQNNHVIYTEDFFDEATFSAILHETTRLWRSDDIEGNCNLDGKHRLGGYVLDHSSQNSSLYKLIYGNEQFRRWVSAVNGEGPMWPSDFPIEVREYGPESKGMGCHDDLQMYAVSKKDVEFAVTIINDSRCNVSFFDAKGVKHEVHTQGNSVMMVRANAATHCVSPTVGGSRTILKFIFVGDYRKSNDFSEYKVNQCGPDNTNNKKLRNRRKKLTSRQEL